MLPSVDSRLSPSSSDEDERSKRKKLKREKKKKKKKKRHKSSSEEDDRVEKNSSDIAPSEKRVNSASDCSLPQRDSWMLFPIPSETKSKVNPAAEIKESETEDKDIKSSSTPLELGQHPRELNPYWKKGGSGLPSERTTAKVDTSGGKRAWFKRAYERAKQQAEDEGRSLEDVATERWGSLEKLKALANGDDDNRRSKSEESHEPRRQRGWRKSRDEIRENEKHGKKISERSSTRLGRESGDGKGMFRKPMDDKGSSFMKLMKPPEDEEGHSSTSKSWNKKYEAYKQGKTNKTGRWRKKQEEDRQKATSPPLPTKQDVIEEKDLEIATSSKQSGSSSESSSEENGEDDKQEKEMMSKRVTEADLNALGAKRLKAELMGNEELAKELDMKLDKLRKVKEKQEQSGGRSKTEENDDNNVVVLTRTDRAGNVVPLNESRSRKEEKGKRRKRHKMVPTHDEEGKRSRYFCDDDNHDLKSLVAQEKTSTAEDQNATYARLAHKLGGQFDLDDKFESAAASKYTPEELEEKSRQKAIREHQRLAAQMENCKFCLDSTELAKHLIIAIGLKVYLTLPVNQSLTDGHCLIVPIMHHTAGTMVDEDIWSEVQIFKKGLTKMFEEMGKDIVFMEMNRNLRRKHHMMIECVPVDKEIGDMAPIYFKKAIQESDSEWAQNKKLIDTRNKSLRSSVPKGLPYFAVEFGLDGGFAHVIENEDLIPHYFGKEIVGGMLELEPFIWKKPRKENFQTQKKKVLQFAEWWKPFDWTQKIQEK
ncbi:CWF19 2 [Paramuricea clavata]|uniref:CWF19 2 n=2 Tax=Paramuricea clavata TaxID=317549 RepID=A0A6S7FVB9_PARCT|nr:CWF19 2 [Paramuricea clavata]